MHVVWGVQLAMLGVACLCMSLPSHVQIGVCSIAMYCE
jgi:hypothetical protein